MRSLTAIACAVGLGMTSVGSPAKAADWSVGISIRLPGVIVVPSDRAYAPPPPRYYVPPPPAVYVVQPPYYASPYPPQIAVPPRYDGGYYWRPARHHHEDNDDD